MKKIKTKTMLGIVVCGLMAMVVSTGAAMAGSEAEQIKKVSVTPTVAEGAAEGEMEDSLVKCEDGKMSISYDNGETWEEMDPSTYEVEINENADIKMDADFEIPEGADSCIVEQDDEGNARMSTDGGKTWQSLDGMVQFNDGEGMVEFGIKTDEEGTSYSTDGGETWSQVEEGNEI